MKTLWGCLACGIALALASGQSEATYNATVTGTITYVAPMSVPGIAAETVVFAISNQPTVNCGGYREFVINPNTVSDAQTRKNMYALLLTAKASGASVTVAYDNTDGGFCDGGRVGVYYIDLL